MENDLKEVHKFKRGDKILVNDSGFEEKSERIFLTYVEGSVAPFICVSSETEINFNQGKPFNITTWTHAYPVPEHNMITLSLAEVIKELAIVRGVNTSDITIVLT